MSICAAMKESQLSEVPLGFFLVWRTGRLVGPPKEMKSVGRGASVKREGSCLSEAQEGECSRAIW